MKLPHSFVVSRPLLRSARRAQAASACHGLNRRGFLASIALTSMLAQERVRADERADAIADWHPHSTVGFLKMQEEFAANERKRIRTKVEALRGFDTRVWLAWRLFAERDVCRGDAAGVEG